jgi:hypothetical protein
MPVTSIVTRYIRFDAYPGMRQTAVPIFTALSAWPAGPVTGRPVQQYAVARAIRGKGVKGRRTSVEAAVQ